MPQQSHRSPVNEIQELTNICITVKLKVQNMKCKMSYCSPQYQDTALHQRVQKEMRGTKAFAIKKPK